MRKPEYKLGDMIQLVGFNIVKLITEVIDVEFGYVYKTRVIEGTTGVIVGIEGEMFIAGCYDVIGNILERKKK